MMYWASGLAAGIIIGFLLQRVGATSPVNMLRACALKDNKLSRFWLLTLGVSLCAMAILDVASLLAFYVVDTAVVAVILGGMLFGLGLGITGYTIATSLVAMGTGSRQALWVLMGAATGSVLFVMVHPALYPVLMSWEIGTGMVSNFTSVPFYIAAMITALCVAWYAYYMQDEKPPVMGQAPKQIGAKKKSPKKHMKVAQVKHKKAS